MNTSKKEIAKLLKNITEGSYADAKKNVKAIVEAKISERIRKLN